MKENMYIAGGRLVADPRFIPHTTNSNHDLATVVLAVNFPSNGFAFVPLACWGPLSRPMIKYGKKGQEVLVHGRIKTTRKDDRHCFELVVKHISFPDNVFKTQTATEQTTEQETPPQSFTEQPPPLNEEVVPSNHDSHLSPEEKETCLNPGDANNTKKLAEMIATRALEAIAKANGGSLQNIQLK